MARDPDTATELPDELRTLSDVPAEPKPVLSDVTIVIPTLGRPILESCLASMLLADAWPACIVVVDQSSSPAIATLLRTVQEIGVPTCYVPSTKRGRAQGLNEGIGRVETQYLAITDDDCLASPDWLGCLRARLNENTDVVVTGRVEPGGDEVPIAVHQSMDPLVQTKPHPAFDCLSGGNMATSAEVFDRVGPFDEDPRIRLAEDGEWAYRALRRGVTIVYAPEVWLTHYAWREDSQREEHYRAYARSHGAFYGKYLRKGDAFIVLRAAIHMARALRRWARGTLKGDKVARAHGRSYATGLLPGVARGWRRDPDSAR